MINGIRINSGQGITITMQIKRKKYMLNEFSYATVFGWQIGGQILRPRIIL